VSVAAGRGFELDAGTPGTLRVTGVLSFDTAAAALQAIRAAAGKVETIDLGGLQRSDSAGLACVLAVVAEGAGRGGKLRVTGMPSGMQALAQVCEVDSLLG